MREAPYIPLEVEIKHPDYAPIRVAKKIYINEASRPAPAYSEGFNFPAQEAGPAARSLGLIELRPSKEVTGIVQSADGKPLARVKVVAHSQVAKNERELHASTSQGQSVHATPPSASEDVTQTDERGRFRVTMITPGEGMLAIYPADGRHTVRYEFLFDKRGDLGVVVLSLGQQIKGRATDSNGKPLAGVFVVERPAKLTEWKYVDNGVVVHPQWMRSAVTDAKGNFAIGPLPPGDYFLNVEHEYVDPSVDRHELPDPRPVSGIFIPQKISIVENQQLPPLDICAPTVTIQGRVGSNGLASGNNPNALPLGAPLLVDNTANSTTGAIRIFATPLYLHGKLQELVYQQRVVANQDGSFQIAVPKSVFVN